MEIPYLSKLKVVLEEDIDSAKVLNKVTVHARTKDDVFSDGKISLPADSAILGVADSTDANNAHSFSVYFDSLKLIDGRTTLLHALPLVRGDIIHVTRHGQELKLNASDILFKYKSRQRPEITQVVCVHGNQKKPACLKAGDEITLQLRQPLIIPSPTRKLRIN